ncbi:MULTISPECIES: EAL domain-containing protein [unclassified Companilactobacillus]|jgi:EAL domain-containing protein (putative c-di-GMP-specific phosphodiesterase class I)|uniref:EAL domain-containing protein n=1 Tax=unclassified Companilactobacillus TaxID=2767904 RepID=UPI002FF0E747
MKDIYRYFVQPQIDMHTQTIMGYELLIKKWTPEGWRLPESFVDIDVGIVSKLLIASTKILGLKVQYCSVNVNREQLMDTQMTDAIIQSQMQLFPTKLVVELTEDKGPKEYPDSRLIPQLRRFMEHGMQISLDDVGTGINGIEHIKDLLPLASEIKFALQNFRSNIEDPNLREKLMKWKHLADKFGQRLVLEGVEDNQDDLMSDSLGINFRQGYYYGKPELLPLPGDTTVLSA